LRDPPKSRDVGLITNILDETFDLLRSVHDKRGKALERSGRY